MSEQIDYQKKLFMFNSQIAYANKTFCEDTTDYEEVCEALANTEKKQIESKSASIRKVKNIFLRSIENLGEDTISFYKGELPNVRIKKKKYFPGRVEISNGSAGIFDLNGKYILFTHKKDHNEQDIAAIYHEFGHIPVIRDGAHGDYYEFDEVLPIYFEYIAYKNLHSENPMELFLQDRINISIDQARLLLRYAKDFCYCDSDKSKYISCQMRSSFKYIKSFEYALQLIEREQEDQLMTYYAIDKVINGESSFRDLEGFLDIDTYGCKKILQRL